MGTNCIPRSGADKISNHPFNPPHFLGNS
jgi:hypothetical protein